MVRDEVAYSSCNDSFEVVASVDSRHLVEMLADMLKFSNNFVAEMLVKNMVALKEEGRPATMNKGILMVKNYLNKIGLKEGQYTLENVSGLTRQNLFSAQDLLMVMSTIAENPKYGPEFLAGLPIAGIDGTMKKRLKDDLPDNLVVRAKTGYLDGVASIAGTITKKTSGPIYFVFMYNGKYDEALESKVFYDQVIKKIIKEFGKSL